MVAIVLLLVVVVDTCVTAYLLARVRELKSVISSTAQVVADISESIADASGAGDAE